MADSASLGPAILGYYNEGGEQGRLETGCRLEFLRTQELIERFLPPLPARVLDVGGGDHLQFHDDSVPKSLTDRVVGVSHAAAGWTREM